ncbi:hypothetical protein PGT21_004719 [Puccinia graminis f. sp. tritici]|uniref:Uncharacterized protein n=1 Tax=Puccinia graminis f. sp. tritici TaxID=56615 RepID=A0A5B0QSI9_PUCGR|nr:hypothetical protein PGT21_004719 [Puccinia graminis f. sp. tritici]
MTMVDTPSTIAPKDTIKGKQITTTSSIIMYRDPIDLNTQQQLSDICALRRRDANYPTSTANLGAV